MLYIIILLFAMIIIKLSAAKLPSAPTAAAARATELPRPRENRAQDPESQPAPHMIRDGQTAPSQLDGTPPARQESDQDATTHTEHGQRHRATTPAGSQDKPRPRADKLPTIRAASYPQPHRAKATTNHAPNAPKRHAARLLQTQNDQKRQPQRPERHDNPPDHPDPVSIFSIFRLDFSIFSRFFAVSIPSPSRFFSIQPAGLPKFSRSRRPKCRFHRSHNSPTILIQLLPQLPPISRAPSVLPFSPFCAIIFSNKFSSFRHKSPKHPIW